MKLWQKKSDSNEIIEDFTVGKDRLLDLKLAYFDVIGSMAHVKMLLETGLLTPAEQVRIHETLVEILRKIENEEFSIREGVEDIHSQVELTLTEILGQTGKKIHTGRSRNDQVLLDLKLFMRYQVSEIVPLAESLFRQLIMLSDRHRSVLMPGYTHFQIAMPSSFGLWFGAYAESLSDDMAMLKAAYELINRNPLGSAAGYGSSFLLNRQMTTDLLAFDTMNFNVVYAQMGRGKAEKSLAVALGSFADSLAKLAYDVILYMSQNYAFISFPEEYTTGSSIMPHKKNPDVFEIIRGKCNQLKALVNEINLLTSNLPSGYHRDMQLLKESLFSGIESLKDCLFMTRFMLDKIEVRENILEDEKYDYLFSVELVNELVRKGKPFRDAYNEVGEKIRDGSYIPDRKIDHSHEGSMGNLMNDRIEERMESYLNFFKKKFVHQNSSIKNLIENN
jgi:argininosuccinate lyase